LNLPRLLVSMHAAPCFLCWPRVPPYRESGRGAFPAASSFELDLATTLYLCVLPQAFFPRGNSGDLRIPFALSLCMFPVVPGSLEYERAAWFPFFPWFFWFFLCPPLPRFQSPCSANRTLLFSCPSLRCPLFTCISAQHFSLLFFFPFDHPVSC